MITPYNSRMVRIIYYLIHLSRGGCLEFFGAETRGRTGDPSLFRGMLYQLSYLGINLLLQKVLNRLHHAG